ncbi:MAG: 2-oxoglutarate-dependent dioxygenase, partial [Rubrivivax sp.]|nr:2-oxoglutarate-dependent dioxygenase [Rubrivivax sp.]
MNTVAAQTITPELRRWIVEQAEAGCRPQDVIEAMKTSGWAEDVAVKAMEQTLREHLAAMPPDEADLPPPNVVPEPALLGGTVLMAAGHPVRVLTTMKHPRVIVFGGLLTDTECTGLMALAQPRLARSETVDNNTGGSEVNAARTSDGMFFERGEHKLIQTIDARIAALLAWPLENGEGL